MRVVEVAGGQGHGQPGSGAPVSGAPFRSAILGPEGQSDQPGLAGQLLGTLGARRARKLAHARDERGGRPPGAESTSTARRTGARHAVADLQGRLGDDWALLRGYRNARGPIGQLLIGPAGLIAMTSYYLDAAVHCHADKWHAEWSAKAGSQHGEMHLDDLDGRSPSVQLNQGADELERMLGSSGLRIRAQRAILLNHPASRAGEFRRPTVRVFTSAADLAAWLQQQHKALDRGVKRRIEELIAHGQHSTPGQ